MLHNSFNINSSKSFKGVLKTSWNARIETQGFKVGVSMFFNTLFKVYKVLQEKYNKQNITHQVLSNGSWVDCWGAVMSYRWTNYNKSIWEGVDCYDMCKKDGTCGIFLHAQTDNLAGCQSLEKYRMGQDVVWEAWLLKQGSWMFRKIHHQNFWLLKITSWLIV